MTLLWSVVVPLIYFSRRDFRSLFAQAPRDIVATAGGGVIASIGYGIIIWAMTIGPMGPVSALRETSVVFAAVIARVFMGERPSPYRIMACLVVVIGTVCLTLG